MRAKSLGLSACALLVACSGGGGNAVKKPIADNPRAAAQALMRSVTLAGGKVQKGGLPATSNDLVKLLPQASDPVEPGATTIMSLDVDNPDDVQNPGKAVLMQFDGASDHLETPVSSSQSGAGDLNFELLVGDDVCTDLCNHSFNVTLQMALALADGSVGAHAQQDLTLDCKKKGDSARCASTSPADAGTGKSSGGKGSDAGTSARPKNGDAGIGAGFDASGLFPDGGFPFDASAFFRDGGPAVDASGLYPDGSVGDGSTNIFPCPMGGTVTFDKLCDGKNDCSDGYDEMVCAPCANGMGKYSPFQQCDGKSACADGTDEMGCDFTCNSGEHVPTTKICNGTNDCADGSDEAPCQFPCGDGTSVPASKVCDGTRDCANGSDEAPAMCP
jgi:hypothetical protein